METTMPTPSELKKLRKDKGMTQAQLAEKAGIKSVATIVNMERGYCTPRDTTLGKVLAVLCPKAG